VAKGTRKVQATYFYKR